MNNGNAISMQVQDANKLLRMLDSAINRLESTLSDDPAKEVFGADSGAYYKLKDLIRGDTKVGQRKSKYNKNYKCIALPMSVTEGGDIFVAIEASFGHDFDAASVENYILDCAKMAVKCGTLNWGAFERSISSAPFKVHFHYPPIAEEWDNPDDYQWVLDEWHRKLHSFEDEGILKHRAPIAIDKL